MYEIRLEGADAAVRGFKEMGDNIPKMVSAVLSDAGRLLVTATKPEIPVRTGKAQASLMWESANGGVNVRGGNNNVLYFRWLEYGGLAGRNHSVKRLIVVEGRYIWPTYLKEQDKIQALLEDGVVSLVKDVGFEVS